MIFELIDGNNKSSLGFTLFYMKKSPPASTIGAIDALRTRERELSRSLNLGPVSNGPDPNPRFKGHKSLIHIYEPWIWDFATALKDSGTFLSDAIQLHSCNQISFDKLIHLNYFNYLLDLNYFIYKHVQRKYSHPIVGVMGLKSYCGAYGVQALSESKVINDHLNLDETDYANDQIVMTITEAPVYGATIDKKIVRTNPDDGIEYHNLYHLVMLSFKKDSFLNFKLSHSGLLS